jgi:hypothetical protein
MNIPLIKMEPIIIKQKINNTAPWPAIILAIIGIAAAVYSGFAPNISSNRRIFAAVTLAVWTLVWCILLWIIWKYNYVDAAWYLLLLSVIFLAAFFIVIVALNL